MNVLRQQINAASAIAAIAQVRFVRTAVVKTERSELLLRAQTCQSLTLQNPAALPTYPVSEVSDPVSALGQNWNRYDVVSVAPAVSAGHPGAAVGLTNCINWTLRQLIRSHFRAKRKQSAVLSRPVGDRSSTSYASLFSTDAGSCPGSM